MSTVAKLLQAGAEYFGKNKKVAKDYAKKSSKMKPGGQGPSGKAKVTMPSKKMLQSGIKKPGMSEGYKHRQRLQKELMILKRQIAKQGHSKPLADKISTLQQKLDNSYGK